MSEIAVSPSISDATSNITDALSRYQLFGLRLASDFAFANSLAPVNVSSGNDPDCIFSFNNNTHCDIDPQKLDMAREKIVPSAPGRLGLYRLDHCDLLRLAGVDFFVFDRLIDAYLHTEAKFHQVEIGLLGTVLAFWLERANIPALHASAVVVDGQALAFLAQNTGGKTTLAASFVQAGFALLSDDIVPVEISEQQPRAHSAYPTMRMWPEQADYFVGAHQHYERVHPKLEKRRIPVATSGLGQFFAGAKSLKRIYLPRRDAGTTAIRVEPVTPGQALIELVRHSFIPYIIDALGWQPRRLGLLKRLVEQVPVCELIYPPGYENLPAVRAAVLQDIGTER